MPARHHRVRARGGAQMRSAARMSGISGLIFAALLIVALLLVHHAPGLGVSDQDVRQLLQQEQRRRPRHARPLYRAVRRHRVHVAHGDDPDPSRRRAAPDQLGGPPVAEPGFRTDLRRDDLRRRGSGRRTRVDRGSVVVTRTPAGCGSCSDRGRLWPRLRLQRARGGHVHALDHDAGAQSRSHVHLAGDSSVMSLPFSCWSAPLCTRR